MLVIAVCVLTVNAYSGTSVNGRSLTHLYSFQTKNGTSEDHLKLYQSFVFNVQELGMKNLSFHTYFRAGHDFLANGAEIPTSLYSAYVNWSKIGDLLDLRIGRQLFHAGVGSGTLDGLKIVLNKKGLFALFLI